MFRADNLDPGVCGEEVAAPRDALGNENGDDQLPAIAVSREDTERADGQHADFSHEESGQQVRRQREAEVFDKGSGKRRTEETHTGQ